ncbi:hypothetical protein GW17_00029604 [Ensete ventricosum]|nr:hypothetical protein GW17_00029604 [Ensete ventricosum]RZR92986.1 hypothetical protein BHM03_00021395 [Ensete ventricosum]
MDSLLIYGDTRCLVAVIYSSPTCDTTQCESFGHKPTRSGRDSGPPTTLWDAGSVKLVYGEVEIREGH